MDVAQRKEEVQPGLRTARVYTEREHTRRNDPADCVGKKHFASLRMRAAANDAATCRIVCRARDEAVIVNIARHFDSARRPTNKYNSL
jgi:hypothetical protein